MIDNKRILCVITARAGSKGIPGKNYRTLMNEPLFMWSVYAALQSEYIDRTAVSSNCAEVYKVLSKFIEPIIDKRSHLPVAERWKAGSVPFFIQRPDEISGDLSKNEEALIHAYNWMKNRGNDYGIIINLQPTSPCRTGRLLDRSIEEYHRGGYDSLLTASKHTPFFWQKKDEKWEYIVDKNNCCDRKMRQEFSEDELILHDDGNIYITNTDILLDRECRIGYNPCIFEVEGLNSLQIDKEYDFTLIEVMAKVMGLNTLVDDWTEL